MSIIRTVDVRKNGYTDTLAAIAVRQQDTDIKVAGDVAAIISAVRLNGDAAVAAYTLRFDGVEQPVQALNRSEMQRLAADCDPGVYAALKRAAARINDFHARQQQNSWMVATPDGTLLGQQVRGLRRVGIYVPGGTAALASSVLMSAIPAKIAGVGEVIMVTPPPKPGFDISSIMAAAVIAGVDTAFLCGGAQAIAALAYGTETIPAVDKIVGPGNAYVAAAKKQVYGKVDIDMVAGPSEILVLADDTANPAWVAADMLSQAEHDPLASAVLVTDSPDLAAAVREQLERQLATLPRREIAAEALARYGRILICADMVQAVEIANAIAPEHLEVMAENPMEYVGRLPNAGALFLGGYAPEPLGDYYAGPNHVLPTSGTARFYSPLGVDSFLKKTSVIYYNEEALRAAQADIDTLAKAEGLDAHARAVNIRIE